MTAWKWQHMEAIKCCTTHCGMFCQSCCSAVRSYRSIDVLLALILGLNLGQGNVWMSGCCTNTWLTWSGTVMLKHSTIDFHVQNDVMLHDFVKISDACRCTHAKCTRAVPPRCYLPTPWNCCHLLHAVWSITFSTSIDMYVSISTWQEKQDFWEQNSPPPGMCSSDPLLAPLQTLLRDMGITMLPGHKLCIVQGFVSLWLLLLWFGLEDLYPDICICWLLCDSLTMVCY